VWALVEECWASDKVKRPTFPEVASRLQPLIVHSKVKTLSNPYNPLVPPAIPRPLPQAPKPPMTTRTVGALSKALSNGEISDFSGKRFTYATPIALWLQTSRSWIHRRHNPWALYHFSYFFLFYLIVHQCHLSRVVRNMKTILGSVLEIPWITTGCLSGSLRGPWVGIWSATLPRKICDFKRNSVCYAPTDIRNLVSIVFSSTLVDFSVVGIGSSDTEGSSKY